MALKEKTLFKADAETTPDGKNSRLAELLNGPLNDLQIVSIERIEIGSQRGWRVTYRE
jgi:hypothetical protein